MIQELVDEISLNFPEFFIIWKYLKIRFKNWGSPCCFLSSRGQKIENITKIEHNETVFVYILSIIFYGASRAKTDLYNKYMMNTINNFVPGSFFEQDHLLNLIILRLYVKE